MSLNGALSIGRTAITAEQAALQVTGNNISNAGTPGYTRQVVNFSPTGDQQVTATQTTGSGVAIVSIERQVNEALNANLRDANSDQSSSQSLNSMLTSLQTTFGPLNDNDLSSQVSAFFNSFSTLANNPTDATLRAQVVQNGSTVAGYVKTLRSQVFSLQQNANAQVSTLATQADSLLSQVAGLNKQIAIQTATGVNALMDQRDQALTQLSQLIGITTVPQPNGSVTVMLGSMPVVEGDVSRGLSTKQVADSTGKFTNTQVVFKDNGDPVTVTGGSLGGTVAGRDIYVTPALNTIDNVAAALINTVNTIHSQGQGLTGFSSLTGTSIVSNSAAALNAGTAATGLNFTPVNGTFNLYMTDKTTGQVTTKQISVNLTGQGTQTTATSLAAAITAAGSGGVSANVNTAGQLAISSNNSNVTFGFGQDSSGVLASLGINTFFTGHDGTDIAVNQVVLNNSDYLATARLNDNGTVNSQANAQAIMTAGSASVSLLGGKSLKDYYTDYIGGLATNAQSVTNDLSAKTTLQSTLAAQQQAISGVSLDEETLNMMQYQRAFEGSARYINVVNQLMQEVLGLVQ